MMVGCLYCGTANPWWLCDCRAAKEVRDGKRAQPRIKATYERAENGRLRARSTVIVVDAATAAHNALGFPTSRI